MSSTVKFFYEKQELEYVYYSSLKAKDLPMNPSPLASGGVVPVGTLPTGEKVRATRRIFFKSNPSLHKCNARCTTARGHNCECSCGGANHGAER